ncbi:hypothetical protein NPIL_165661 [Nephila pilipes]|uniref:Uncharacterized protein n=1 Tax=Nephila pilipes TaxID=299642 RepID=A0A8X6PM41_NEPPI|nr:hypothetical protein NPIL_165661 [Nephila pilipes]
MNKSKRRPAEDQREPDHPHHPAAMIQAKGSPPIDPGTLNYVTCTDSQTGWIWGHSAPDPKQRGDSKPDMQLP